ncbi:hypothetical protein EMIT0111MI5_210121 [Burkholderia sp. IT-111MI5]
MRSCCDFVSVMAPSSHWNNWRRRVGTVIHGFYVCQTNNETSYGRPASVFSLAAASALGDG